MVDFKLIFWYTHFHTLYCVEYWVNFIVFRYIRLPKWNYQIMITNIIDHSNWNINQNELSTPFFVCLVVIAGSWTWSVVEDCSMILLRSIIYTFDSMFLGGYNVLNTRRRNLWLGKKLDYLGFAKERENWQKQV